MSNDNQNDQEQTSNHYVMTAKNAMQKAREKEQEKQRQRDIEANRIEPGTDDLFKRLVNVENKLQKRSMTSTLVIVVCIVLSTWLIPKHYVTRTTILTSSPSLNIDDVEGAWKAYKNGSTVLLEGICDGGENYAVPVSILSSSMYWINQEYPRSYQIVRAGDGSLVISIKCTELS